MRPLQDQGTTLFNRRDAAWRTDQEDVSGWSFPPAITHAWYGSGRNGATLLR